MDTSPTRARLILIDVHPLVPFSVRSHQFSCRGISFAQHWPGAVELWLPGPEMSSAALARRAGMSPTAGFACRFGPPSVWSVLGIQVRSRARFRRWVRGNLRALAAADSRCLFYFRTLKLAHHLRERIRDSGWRYVFEPHEVFYESAKRPAELRPLEHQVYQNAAHLFPITRALDRALQLKLPVTTPTTVAPLGHSGVNFSLPPYDPQAPPRLLYVGSLHKWKGLTVAFEASADLGVPFDIVGDAGGLVVHREYCRHRNLAHVQFHGEVLPDQVGGFYQTGSICLLPLSDAEIARAYTSPLKLFEYLAAGRPVVAGDVPSLREIVTDAVQARLVQVGDVAAWRAALKELLGDRLMAQRLAAQGRALAESCTWTKRAGPIVETLKAMV
jgi:glycosyltransferase involved in cell wall biosynthesis